MNRTINPKGKIGVIRAVFNKNICAGMYKIRFNVEKHGFARFNIAKQEDIYLHPNIPKVAKSAPFGIDP